MGLIVLLRSPPASQPDVEELSPLERGEAEPSAEALVAVVVLQRRLGGLVLPATGDPADHVQPGRELIGEGDAGHALRPAEALELRRGGGEVERGVVALVAERGVEAPEGERQPVADRGYRGDVEPVQADLGCDRLGPEALEAIAAGRRTPKGLTAVSVTLTVALDLD